MNGQFDVAQNIFAENKGQWSLFALATKVNQFNGTIRFNGNENYRNTLTSHFQMTDNKFEQFDFHVNVKREYNEVSVLQHLICY